MSAKKRILLVGAGPTSSLISYNISKNKSLRDALDIHVWDKARGVGGRFSTSRSPKNPDCYLDLGAQYLTRSMSHPSSSSYFESLNQGNLIRPLDTSDFPGFRADSSKNHFVCLKGSASIVKHFFEQASISKNDIVFNQRVTKIRPVSPEKVEVTAENGAKDTFDIVVSTMPAPQVLQLENFSELVKDQELQRKLEAVKFSSRFALGIFFDSEVRLTSSTKPINFVENDPMIRYWSIENLKRNGKYMGATSVVVHTNIDFGAANVDVDTEVMKPKLVERITSSIIPEVSSLSSDSIKSHKWRYSQVLDCYPEKPGCVTLTKNVFAAGDSFSGSGLEGCIDSAENTISAIKSLLG